MKSLMFSLTILVIHFLTNTVQADSNVIKAYKVAFPDSNPKCTTCHLASFPWEHPWNAYGKAVKKAINATGVGEVPTSNDASKIIDVFKQIGKSEDFKVKTENQ